MFHSLCFLLSLSTLDSYAGPPEVIIDPVSRALVPAGQAFNLTCYAAGVLPSNEYEVQWLTQNQTSLPDGAVVDQTNTGAHTLQLMEASIGHSGYYACEVTVGNRTYLSQTNVSLIVTGELIGASSGETLYVKSCNQVLVFSLVLSRPPMSM